ILKQDFGIHVIFFEFNDTPKQQVNLALAQIMIVEHCGITELNVKRDPRALRGQPIENCGEQSGSDRLGTADSQVTRRGIRQKPDVLHASSKLVKNDKSSVEHGPAVNRGLDALQTRAS